MSLPVLPDLDALRRRIEMRRYYGKTVPVDADDLDALLRVFDDLRSEPSLLAENRALRAALEVRGTGEGPSLPPSSNEARVERARTVAWLRAIAGQYAVQSDLVGSGLAQVWQIVATLIENREPERWTQELHELHEED
jgi:hypothetical protein